MREGRREKSGRNRKRNGEGSLGLSGQFASPWPTASPSTLKTLPMAGIHLQMTSGSTLQKPQEQGRLGRLCGAALTRCCGGDKTSDSLIDGLADITIPCESTEWPMPGPHF